jgi:anti-sigma28 factor (negative regulator of flagellin synthesis)
MNIYDIDREIHRCLRPDHEEDQPTTRVRLEKVRALRDEIERGAYQIRYDKIAENMLLLFTDAMPWGITHH